MDDNPVMIPGPGTECALVKSDHEAILCVPEEYCSETVFPVAVFSLLVILLKEQDAPISANLRSSKITKSSCFESSTSLAANSSVKSSIMSQCVSFQVSALLVSFFLFGLLINKPTLTIHTLPPTILTISRTSSASVTSTLTHKFVRLRSMMVRIRRAVGLVCSVMREAYVLSVVGCGILV